MGQAHHAAGDHRQTTDEPDAKVAEAAASNKGVQAAKERQRQESERRGDQEIYVREANSRRCEEEK